MLWRLLKTYLAPFRRDVMLVLGLQLVATIAALYLPTLNADIIDNGVITGDTGYILRTGAVMLVWSLIHVGATVIAVYFGSRTAMGLGRQLRSAIFRKVGEFSGREVAGFGAPSLITRNTNDVQQIQTVAAMALTMMVTAPIMMIGGVIMALREDVGLSWLVVVAVPMLAVSVGFIASRLIPSFRSMQKRIDSVNRILREQATGIRVLRAFVREPYEAERFDRANTELTDVSVTVGRWMSAMFPLVMLILNLSTVAVLWFGGLRVDAGTMEIGSLTAFITYLLQILMSVMMATFMLVMLPRAAVSADRIGEVLDTEPSVRVPEAGVTRLLERGHLRLEDGTFAYPGADVPVVSDVSIEARPGETLAIIGSTGAGKTTLVSLIPRLFDTTSGRVLVDDVDVRELDPEALWSRIGLVPQRPYLFSGTVASNLRFGKPDATEDEMWEALEIAQAREFVEAMPDGLDSPIAQGGTNVSGGQRQRLQIARALIKRPEIYIFDDSFSALDLATDARLRRALQPITRDATVVIVAQRVSTIADADRILVLEDGRAVGIGTHRELLATCPTYVEIVESQAQAEAV
ncbi:MAG TPA: ABC transporter ATP-binding protein [Acidimicrobiia bacterium]|jgi:ATP-binding cassette subfamily B protein|nr:ABC transporter ATP-binding protein [Acidimicrobiia bacterium]